MHFYVDETGQTGKNLFDATQPVLSYGVLSSPIDLQVGAASEIARIRNKLGCERLHAAELGETKLALVAGDIKALLSAHSCAFQIHSVVKADHAIISFFDQVFDAGVNPAVPRFVYWSPLRYFYLANLSTLFDAALLKKAWSARLEPNTKKAQSDLIAVCETLFARSLEVTDPRTRQILSESLIWAAHNPAAIGYNAESRSDSTHLTPNLIAFQSVLFGIAGALKGAANKKVKIVVDRQKQFNQAQRELSKLYASLRDQTIPLGFGLPTADFRGMPVTEIECTAGQLSVGLEVIDVALWLENRRRAGKLKHPHLIQLSRFIASNAEFHELSIKSLMASWGEELSRLPEPLGEQGQVVAEFHERLEQARYLAMTRAPTAD